MIKFFKPNDQYGCLSNWSNHSVVIDDIKFKTAEHALMYKKAMTFNDKETADKILKVSHPFVAKKLGREVKNFNEDKWNQDRYDVMVNILRNKAKQHPKLLNELKATGNKLIVENSPFDNIWGIGRNGKGQNLLGKAWMDVRSSI